MPEWAVQRRFPRYMVHLSLLYKVTAPTDTEVEVGWARDLSERGACVELAERLWPQTPIHLCLQTGRGHLEVEARVAWTGEPNSARGCTPHGLAFTKVAEDQLQALRDLIFSREQVRQAGVRLPVTLPVTFRPKGHSGPSLHGRTGDISRGGLSLRLLQAFPPGMALEVTLQGRTGPLTAEGTIAWVAPPDTRRPGELIPHGLRFTAVRFDFSLTLARFLAMLPLNSHPEPRAEDPLSPR
ncbi:MAG: PilZ domain-containing protein [Candidatus Methylomirabilales bacterium]